MGDSTPICRCRVLYLGSAVPRQSKDGLQGIQEPLRSLYPSEGALGAKGIDSWLSVWSNGILLENVDENRKQVTRFFPIESLHYCAAVRQVLVPERGNSNPEPKFLPLDSPFARAPKGKHPPIFAAILRRTTGIKVLECHVFICKREAAANALVRCCFHAYADNSYARQLEVGGGSSSGGAGGGAGGGSLSGSVYGTLSKRGAGSAAGSTVNGAGGEGWRSRAGSTMTLNSLGRQQQQQNGGGGSGLMAMNGNSSTAGGGGGAPSGSGGSLNGLGDAYAAKNLYASSADLDVVDDGDGASIYNGNENHKVWSGSQDRLDAMDNEGPYDFYASNGGGVVGGSSTIGRTPRARQISAPVPVPSPPKELELLSSKAAKQQRSGSSKSMQQQHQQQQHQHMRSSSGGSGGGGHPHNGGGGRHMMLGSQSLSGTLIRPKPVHAGTLIRGGNGGGPPPPPNALIYAGPGGVPMLAAAGPPMPPQRQFHTFSHRGYMAAQAAAAHQQHAMQQAAMHHHPHQPHPHHHPHHPNHHHLAMQQHHAHQLQHQQQQQQLMHHHHAAAAAAAQQQAPPAFALMPQQYATLQTSRGASSGTGGSKKAGKSKGKDKNGIGLNGGGIPLGMPVQPPAMFAYATPVAVGANGGGSSMIGEPRPLALSSRKLAQSAAAGLDDMHSMGGGGVVGNGNHSGAESPGGTGIYRRKGHLNERAFSYSIRQEHRSRSHGSLASLQFNPPDLKKEREIAQMVAALDLNASNGGGGANGHHDEAAMSGLGSGAASSLGGGGNNNQQAQHQLQLQQQQHHHHHHHHHHNNNSVLANGGTGTFGKPRR